MGRNPKKSKLQKSTRLQVEGQLDIHYALDVVRLHADDCLLHHPMECEGLPVVIEQSKTTMKSRCMSCSFFCTSTLHTVGWVDGTP